MPSSYFNRPRRYYKHAAPAVWYKDFSLLLKLLPPVFLLVISSMSLLILSSGTYASAVPNPVHETQSAEPPAVSGASSESSDTASSDSASSDVPSNVLDWKLLLVNTERPLPEGYAPELSQFGPGQARCDARIKDSIEQMLSDAAAAGCKVSVLSDYRTVEKQTELFENKVNRVMRDNPDMSRVEAETEAAKVVAYPGTSEHHTGLAFDIASEGDYDLTERFARSEAYQWLKAHCVEYGFVERYPEDKVAMTGITYEPWHYRYVGEENAREMQSKGLCLEEYVEYLENLGGGATSQVSL